MNISPELFQAYLKCPMKCWLRAAGESSTGNTYHEWVKTQDETYRSTETSRLVDKLPNGDVAISPDSENLKSAKWKLATNFGVQAPYRSADSLVREFLPYLTTRGLSGPRSCQVATGCGGNLSRLYSSRKRALPKGHSFADFASFAFTGFASM